MRYTGPRNRVARREGIDLGLKTPGSKSHARLLKKISVPPGQHGARLRRKVSERARQLRETQKLRFMFGITAKQLKNYFEKAIKTKGNTALFMCGHLESRLDNIVFRLGLAPTRAAARQYVNHGHIAVDGKRVSIASYTVVPGNAITYFGETIQKTPLIVKLLEVKDLIMPTWLERQGSTGTLLAKPNSDIIKEQIDLRLVVEYFSR